MFEYIKYTPKNLKKRNEKKVLQSVNANGSMKSDILKRK